MSCPESARQAAEAEWDGALYTAQQLNEQGYWLGWIPAELIGKPGALAVGDMIKHPNGGPDHVVVRVLNPYQVATMPWTQVPGVAGVKQ